MKIIPFPTWDDGNKWWPLPPDYMELTKEGKRQAHINGCRQWCLSYDRIARLINPTVKRYSDLSPSERALAKKYKAETLVASMYLFNKLYLQPIHDDEGNKLWDPMFYKGFLPRPAFHDDVLRSHAVNRFGAEVEPRGGGKTTNLSAMCMMKFVSCPGREIVYCTASHSLAERVGGKIKQQLQDNSVLIDDWSPEYEGPFKPDRGDSAWGSTAFVARNYASFMVSSVGSVQRGLRADDYYLDDPEWDPDASTDMQVSRDDMQHLILRVIIPMVTKPGASLWWQGTFVSQRHFLWAAMENKRATVDGKVIGVPAIDEFEGWHRKAIDVIYEGPNGPQSIWPEMWPYDEKDKEKRQLPPETITLKELEKKMGSSAFMAEMRAQPGGGGAAYFGELSERMHGWWLEEESLDDAAAVFPRNSETNIQWYRGDKSMSMPLKDFLAKSRVFITLDHAYTEKTTSDFKVATCMAVTEANELFVLDTWGDNLSPVGVLVKNAFQMGEKWGAAALCPEKVKEGYALIAALQEVARTRASDLMGTNGLTPIRPLKIGTIEKTAKISAMLIRFEHGKIKLPMRMSGRDKWRPLFNQIRDFNPNAPDGGLKRDDFIDTVAMSQFVSQLPPSPIGVPVVDPGTEALARWRKGERTDKFGFPLIYTLPTSRLTPEDVRCLFHPPSRPENQTRPLM